MKQLKYRDILSGEFWNIAAFSKFIRKEIIKSMLVTIEFTDDDLDEIRKLYKTSATEVTKNFDINFTERGVIGTDNRIYILNGVGIAKQSDKYYPFKKAVRYNRKNCIKLNKGRLYTAKRLAEFDKTQIVSLPSFSRFKAYEYIDKENSICFRYRLRACKEKGKPLVTYFHGGGALGHDNIKQLAEFRMMGGGLTSRKATILLPQAPLGTNNWLPGHVDTYLSTVKRLIETLAEQNSADNNRVSLVGTSFGGCCTWQMIWDYPGYFSCAVPVMGSLAESWENFSGKNVDISRLKDERLWVAHSANDNAVKIEFDDLCVKKLHELGANVKYTRWEQYGHKMYSKFYRRGNWVDWMLSQSLDNR